MERRLRIYAPPCALALAWLVVHVDSLRALARTFASMWQHELGHAVCGWLCGFAALPGPWRTRIPEERSYVFVAVLAAALAGGAWVLWKLERRRLAALAAGVLVLQLFLTFAVRPARAHALITFFGDGGAMVLGAVGVALFFVPPGSALHRTGVRWGLLVLGAFGLADPLATWWRARHDLDAIPFGEIDGVGDSDPSVLVDEHGWGMHAMITRYVAVGITCVLALAALWAWQALRARSRPPTA